MKHVLLRYGPSLCIDMEGKRYYGKWVKDDEKKQFNASKDYFIRKGMSDK